MEIKETLINLPEGSFNVELQYFSKTDKVALRNIYDKWVNLSNLLQGYGGRRINLPELLSEAIYCMNFNAGRLNSSIPKADTSFDCYNIKSQKRIQVKACSVGEDLTSFGPKSVWDELYFIHFYPNLTYDGTYFIYKIDNDLIYNHKVNKGQTMRQQQNDKRRPRFSIMKELIRVRNIKPIIKGQL